MSHVVLLLLLSLPTRADTSTPSPSPAPDAKVVAAADALWNAMLHGDAKAVADAVDDTILFDAADPILNGPSTRPAAAAHLEPMPRARFAQIAAIHNFQLRGGSPWWRFTPSQSSFPELARFRLWAVANISCHDVGPGGTRAVSSFEVYIAFRQVNGKLRAAALFSKYSGEHYYK